MPFKRFLERLRLAPAPAPSSQPYLRKELAAAALLIEAARIDCEVSEEERLAVARLISERLALPPDEAARLLEPIPAGELAAEVDDSIVIQAVREGFAEGDREDILEMIWEVIYADGQLTRFEDLFMQRMVQSLGVNAQAAERARSCAFAQMSAANQRGSEA